jgi:hypothetical protein
MRETLRQRDFVRLESLLIRVAALAVVLAGTWFISWQLGHAIGLG